MQSKNEPCIFGLSTFVGLLFLSIGKAIVLKSFSKELCHKRRKYNASLSGLNKINSILYTGVRSHFKIEGYFPSI